MANDRFTAQVPEEVAEWLASLGGLRGTDSRIQITHTGGGRIEFDGATFGILARLPFGHDGEIAQDRSGGGAMWIGDDAYPVTWLNRPGVPGA